MAVTNTAYASLWRYCFDVDLRTETVARDRPVDDPIHWILADPRKLSRALRDGVWLRLVDVETALSARSYATSGTLVIDVKDSTCPWNQGRYSLDVGPQGSAYPAHDCAEPDIIMPASCLATCYLGAASASSLARAGRVEARSEGALALADLMFETSKQPWSPDPWPL